MKSLMTDITCFAFKSQGRFLLIDEGTLIYCLYPCIYLRDLEDSGPVSVVLTYASKAIWNLKGVQGTLLYYDLVIKP